MKKKQKHKMKNKKTNSKKVISATTVQIDEFKLRVNEIIDKVNLGIMNFSNLDMNFSISNIDSDLNHYFDANMKSLANNKVLNEKIAFEIFEVMRELLNNYLDEIDYLTERMLYDFIEDICITLLFEIDANDKQEADRFIKFTNYLKDLSVRTYETDSINFGLIYIEDTNDIGSRLSGIGIKYIPISSKIYIEDLVNKEKPLLKLVDNKSVSLVVDKDFTVLGFAKKIQGNKSIEDILLENYFDYEYSLFKSYTIQEIIRLIEDVSLSDIVNESMNLEEYSNDQKENLFSLFESFNSNRTSMLSKLETFSNTSLNTFSEKFKYIRIINSEIQWYFSNSYVLTLKNNKWKLKHYILLSSIILEHLFLPTIMTHTFSMDANELVAYVEKQVEKVIKLISVIRKMSEKNIGGLFVLITEKSFDEERTETEKALEKLIKKNNQIENYKLILNDRNLHEIDEYFLMLVASIDGATILDDNLNILSFSEIIINDVDEEVTSKCFGARTNAAIVSSKYGLAIKISEDGDIELYREGRLIFKI